MDLPLILCRRNEMGSSNEERKSDTTLAGKEDPLTCPFEKIHPFIRSSDYKCRFIAHRWSIEASRNSFSIAILGIRLISSSEVGRLQRQASLLKKTIAFSVPLRAVRHSQGLAPCSQQKRWWHVFLRSLMYVHACSGIVERGEATLSCGI